MPTPINPENYGIFPPGFILPMSFPVPGMYLDGAGDFASTPDDNSLDVTGDIDIRGAFLLVNWSLADVALASKSDSAGQRSWYLALDHAAGGKLQLYWSADGTNFVTTGISSTAPAITSGAPLLVRATLKVANPWQVKFYTRPFRFTTYAADLADDTVAAGAWVQLGTAINGAVGSSIFSGASTVKVGAAASSSVASIDLNGAAYGLVVKNGIAGTTVASPDFGAQVESATAFTDTAGRTWSMNGDAYMIPHLFDTALLADGSPFDPALYPELDQAYGHGKVHGVDATTGWPKLPDYMNTNRVIRAGYKVGQTGGVASHSLNWPTNTTITGTAARLNQINGGTPASIDNQPPYLDAAVWIKV